MTFAMNKKIVIAIIVAVLAAGAALGAVLVFGGSGKEDVQSIIDLGMKYVNDYDYESGILNLRHAIEIEPNNEEAKNGLIRAYTEYGKQLTDNGQYDEAVRIYRDLSKLAPSSEHDSLLSDAMLMAAGKISGKTDETDAPAETEQENEQEKWHQLAHTARKDGDAEKLDEAEKKLSEELHAVSGFVFSEEVTKEPSCLEDGEKTYTCSICGETIKEKIPAAGSHTWDSGTALKGSDCTAEGKMEYTCTVCGEKKTETVPAGKAHTWGSWTVLKQATCSTEGERSHTCSVCGTTEKEKIAATGVHQWDSGKITKQATCVAAGEKTITCKVCGKTQKQTISATGQHKWDSGKVTKQATCGAAGEKTLTCTVCGKTQKQTIAATGQHKWDSGKVTKEATATQTGEKTYTCTVCKTTKKETIPKLNNVVVFDDDELEYAIRKIMLRPSGDITLADAQKVQSLLLNDDNMRGSGPIKSLNALKYFTNLVEFSIDNTVGMGKEDFGVIDWNNDLTGYWYNDEFIVADAIIAHRNEFTDLNALSGLTKLKRLSLPHGAISDISGIKGLTALTVLNLADNAVKSVGALEKMTKLSNLNLSTNKITDITALKGLTSLELVNLKGNQIKDYSPLDNLPNLVQSITG